MGDDADAVFSFVANDPEIRNFIHVVHEAHNEFLREMNR